VGEDFGGEGGEDFLWTFVDRVGPGAGQAEAGRGDVDEAGEDLGLGGEG